MTVRTLPTAAPTSTPAAASAPAAGRAALRALGYWLVKYRRSWRGSVVSTFANPLLYLAAMGVGLGSLVNRSAGAAQLGGVSYLAFIAPGMLAAAAMQVASGEATYPVMGAIKWDKTYHAMLATPLSTRDVLAGHLSWMAVRLTTGSTAFLAVMVLFGALHSGWAVLALPAAVLTGLAFAAPIAAFAATQTNDASFALLWRLGVMPMFLFSGVFFPIDRLPAVLRPVAYATPLWHGVDLCRGLTLGTGLTPARAALHVGYLVLVAVAGYVAARITYRRGLVS
jgi:lipooligosaccharide transport system permease protein